MKYNGDKFKVLHLGFWKINFLSAQKDQYDTMAPKQCLWPRRQAYHWITAECDHHYKSPSQEGIKKIKSKCWWGCAATGTLKTMYKERHWKKVWQFNIKLSTDLLYDQWFLP